MSSEDELLGHVKLRNAYRNAMAKVNGFLGFEGPIRKALEMQYGPRDLPEREFRALLSVEPDKLVGLAEQLRAAQSELQKTHSELNSFENRHPEVVKLARG